MNTPPTVQLDALDIVEYLVHQTGPGVLVLHLSLLHPGLQSCDSSIDGKGENHYTDSYHHLKVHNVRSEDQAAAR